MLQLLSLVVSSVFPILYGLLMQLKPSTGEIEDSAVISQFKDKASQEIRTLII